MVAKKIKQPWDPDAQIISPLSTPASGLSIKRKKCIIDDPMDYVDTDTLSIWNLIDLTSAGKLLRKPPLPCHFDDEHEMRRVYSMIYDVYRCKFSQKFYRTSFANCDFFVIWQMRFRCMQFSMNAFFPEPSIVFFSTKRIVFLFISNFFPLISFSQAFFDRSQ